MAQPPWPPSKKSVSRSVAASLPAAVPQGAVSPTKRTRDERDEGDLADLSSSDGEVEVLERLLSGSMSRSTSATSLETEQLRASLESALGHPASSGMGLSREGSREHELRKKRPVTEVVERFVGHETSSRREARRRPSLGTIFGGDEPKPTPSRLSTLASTTLHQFSQPPSTSRPSVPTQTDHSASSYSSLLRPSDQLGKHSTKVNETPIAHVDSSKALASVLTASPPAAAAPSRLPPSARLPPPTHQSASPDSLRRAAHDSILPSKDLNSGDGARSRPPSQPSPALVSERAVSAGSPPGALDATNTEAQAFMQWAPSTSSTSAAPPLPSLSKASTSPPPRPIFSNNDSERIQRPSYSPPLVSPPPPQPLASFARPLPPPSTTVAFLMDPGKNAQELARLAVPAPSSSGFPVESQAPKARDSSPPKDVASSQSRSQSITAGPPQREVEMLILSDDDDEDVDVQRADPLFTEPAPPPTLGVRGPLATIDGREHGSTNSSSVGNPSTHRSRQSSLPRPNDTHPVAPVAPPPSTAHKRPGEVLFIPSSAKKSARSPSVQHARNRVVKSTSRGGVIIPFGAQGRFAAPLAPDLLLHHAGPAPALSSSSTLRQSISPATSTLASRPTLRRASTSASHPTTPLSSNISQPPTPFRPSHSAAPLQARPRSDAPSSARLTAPRTRSKTGSATAEVESSSDDSYTGPTLTSLTAEGKTSKKKTPSLAGTMALAHLPELRKEKEEAKKRKAGKKIARRRTRIESEDVEADGRIGGVGGGEEGGPLRRKGKGKTTVPVEGEVSSSEDDYVISYAPKDLSVEKRLSRRATLPSRRQAWEEADPEDFPATAHHLKRLTVAISSVTLAKADTEPLFGVNIAVSLHKAASDELVARSSRSNLTFGTTVLDPTSSTVRTFRRQPVAITLNFDPNHLRLDDLLLLRIAWQHGPDALAESLPLTTSSGRLLISRPPSTVLFGTNDGPRLELEIGWEIKSVGDGQGLGEEKMLEETTRRLRRLKIDEKPVWIPSARPVFEPLHKLRVPKLSSRRRGFDQLTKHAFESGQVIPDTFDWETPTTSSVAIALFDKEVRRADLTPKERLIYQLHYRWTQLHPFSSTIFDREAECWTFYAPVVHHFAARLELSLYLHEMVVRDALPSAPDGKARKDDRQEKQRVLRGLMSADDWMKVMEGYDGEVKKVELGKRDNYEEWRAREEREEKG